MFANASCVNNCFLVKKRPGTAELGAIRPRRALMQIGKPLRTIVVEPLEPPVDEPERLPSEPTVQPEPEPEQEPATK